MRILIFGLSSQLGGVESFILSFSRKFLELNEAIRLHFIVFNEIPTYCSDLVNSDKCSFVVVPSRITHPISYRRILCNQLKKTKYDILWYNVCTLSDISLLKLAVPYIPHRVVHSHNSENMGTLINKIMHGLHKKLVDKYASEYFACSYEAAEFMFNEPTLDCNQVTIITNAIDIKRFAFSLSSRNELRKKYDLGDSLVVGHVGRFHPQKNHEFIIDVFNNLLKIEHNSYLILIGEGPLKSNIECLVKKLQLSDKVIILNPLIDVEKYYSAMDIFLFPSLYEGLGIAAIEAQTSGLPTLLSDKIPSPCKISDSTAFLSLGDNAEEWAKTLKQLYDNRLIASREQGQNAARLHGYDIDIEARKLLQYFFSFK